MPKWGTKKADASGMVCATCGVDVRREAGIEPGDNPGIWTDKASVYHCPGQSHAFRAKYKREAHHYVSLHGNCPTCGADLGCARCSGVYRDLLCMACGTFIDGSKPVPREEGAKQLRAILRRALEPAHSLTRMEDGR